MTIREWGDSIRLGFISSSRREDNGEMRCIIQLDLTWKICILQVCISNVEVGRAHKLVIPIPPSFPSCLRILSLSHNGIQLFHVTCCHTQPLPTESRPKKRGKKGRRKRRITTITSSSEVKRGRGNLLKFHRTPSTFSFFFLYAYTQFFFENDMGVET